MADAGNALPPSKKRAAGRELSRDDPDSGSDDDTPALETGTFKKASEEVLATRRIIKPRRHQPPASSSNPFASIRLVPPVTNASAKAPEVTTESQPDAEKNPDSGEVDEKIEGGTGTETNEKAALKVKTDENEAESSNKEKNDSVGMMANAEEADEKKPAEDEGAGKETKKVNGHGDASSPAATTLNSFQQLSSNQNAFTGIAGTGFSSSTFLFGSLTKGGSSFGSGSGSGSGSSFPSFNFGMSDNGGSNFFGIGGVSSVCQIEGSGFPSMQEVPVETGEENEKAVFTADAVLFEYIDGGWKERGKGEIKVNVATTGDERARLVMRARGNLRLILNANLFPDMKLTNMDKRGVTFACMNIVGVGKDGLITFALKFKDGSVMEEFRTAVTLHKGKKPPVLKTPENSPKASDD